MKVLNLLSTGHNGGIEKLCVDHSRRTTHDEHYIFAYEGGVNADTLINEKNKVIILSNINSNFLKLKRIYEYLNNNKIDIIVIHHATPLFYFLGILLKLFSESINVTCYAHCDFNDMYIEKNFLKTLINKRLIKLCFKKCDAVIAISKFVENSVKRGTNLNANKIRLIYNGVDESKILTNQHNYLGNHIIKIIFIGRLIPQKGLNSVISILSKIENKIEFHLTIVGTGYYEKELLQLVEISGILNKVSFVGDRNDVPQMLSQQDVFIHFPNWEEGFGLTIVEALMSGLICVCNNKGAIEEIIDNEINGYIFSSDSIDYIAQKVSEILLELGSEKNANIRKNAIATANKFTIDSYSQSLNAFYNEF